MHRTFRHGQGPHELLKRFPSIRASYYSDGEAEYETLDESSALFRVSGASSYVRADCESTAGYFEAGISLSGGLMPEVNVRSCRARGDRSCEFLCRWQGLRPTTAED